MHCPIYLGSVCILLEDLGFTRRSLNDEVTPMTYCRMNSIYDKIFADVDIFYMLEMMLSPEQIMIDRWTINETGKIYIADDGLDIDIYDPSCIDEVTRFVQETIIIAKEGPCEYY
jgi:hypothetical protein